MTKAPSLFSLLSRRKFMQTGSLAALALQFTPAIAAETEAGTFSQARCSPRFFRCKRQLTVRQP